jgi:hypothetical protein
MQSKYDTQETEQETRDELDLYEQSINAVHGDEFLERNQVGLGNLNDDEMWQQIESYKNGMYGEAAFGTVVDNLLVEETKRELALQQWGELGETDEERREKLRENEDWDYPSKRAFVERKKDELWDRLGPSGDVGSSQDRRAVRIQNQVEKIEEVTGRLPGWTSPHWRMLLMRLDSSRSRDGRLIDNVFGRVQEQRYSGDGDVAQLLGGGQA